MDKYLVRGLITGLVLFAGVITYAQTTQVIGPTDKLTWDQDATNLAEAQSMRFTAYVDNSVTGVVVTATCAGATSPFKCQIANPATAIGSHTVQLMAELPLSGGGYIASPKSVVCNFRVATAPSAPRNLFFIP